MSIFWVEVQCKLNRNEIVTGHDSLEVVVLKKHRCRPVLFRIILLGDL